MCGGNLLIGCRGCRGLRFYWREMLTHMGFYLLLSLVNESCCSNPGEPECKSFFCSNVFDLEIPLGSPLCTLARQPFSPVLRPAEIIRSAACPTPVVSPPGCSSVTWQCQRDHTSLEPLWQHSLESAN